MRTAIGCKLQNKRGRPPGFTLVELLVVIGIIALLIGILLPVLARARASANDVACASNVRQIVTGLRIYATENHDYLPPIESTDPTNPDPTTNLVIWQVPLWQSVLGKPFPTTDYTGGGTYGYLAHTVFECPVAGMSMSVNFGDADGYSTHDHRQNGYAMNATTYGTNGAAAQEQSWPNSNLLTTESKMVSKVHDPSATMLLIDARNFFVQYYDRGSALNSMDALGGDGNEGGILQARGRHGKFRDAWNVAFFDGSVRLIRFNDIPVPPTPGNYLANSLARLSPEKIVGFTPTSAMTTIYPNFSSESFKMFWAGRTR